MNKNNIDYDIIKNDTNKNATQKKTSFNKRSASMDDEIKPLVYNQIEDKSNPLNKKMLSLVSEMDEFYKDGKFRINQKENLPNEYDNKKNLKPLINGRTSSAIHNSRLEKIYEQTSCLFNNDFYDTNLNSKKFNNFLCNF
jgi:hypothetical protein